MKLVGNPFLRAIESGQPQIGLWISLSHRYAAEVVAGAGYDWVLLDTEHAPNDLSTVLSQLQVFAAYDTTPIVRPAWNDTVLVKRLLDIGSPGLLFPMVQTAQEARRAVAATRYPPNGVRGVGGTTRANQFGRVEDYFSRIESETAVLIQAETLTTLEHIDALTDIDGVDGVFFGPSDISADFGLIGQPGHPEVKNAVIDGIKKVRAAGKSAGVMTLDDGLIAEYRDAGANFLSIGLDTNLLAKAVDALAAKWR